MSGELEVWTKYYVGNKKKVISPARKPGEDVSEEAFELGTPNQEQINPVTMTHICITFYISQCDFM